MFVIFSREDGHIIDTADTVQDAYNRFWWRWETVTVASRSWFDKYGPK